jgi:hypothetical protein
MWAATVVVRRRRIVNISVNGRGGEREKRMLTVGEGMSVLAPGHQW